MTDEVDGPNRCRVCVTEIGEGAILCDECGKVDVFDENGDRL